MATFGQIVAAVAGGAILAIAAMLALRLHTVQRESERERRVETAVRAMVLGVETFRRGLSEDGAADAPPTRSTAPIARVDGRATARLRLIVSRPASRGTGRAAPPQRPHKSGPARGR